MPNPFLFISQLVSLLLRLTVRSSLGPSLRRSYRSIQQATSTFGLSSSSFLSSNLQSHKRTSELYQAIETRRLSTRSQGLLKDQDSLVLKVVISIYSKKLRSSAGEPINKTEELRGESWVIRLLSSPSLLRLVGSSFAVIHRQDKVFPINREESFFWPATAYTRITQIEAVDRLFLQCVTSISLLQLLRNTREAWKSVAEGKSFIKCGPLLL